MERGKIPVICTGCGNVTYKFPSHVTKYPFCKRTCYDAFTLKTTIERFWQRVHKTDTCWLYIGSRQPGKWNYGRVKMRLNRKRIIAAHRAAWILCNGAIPQGLDVLHHCDNPPCCNPNHLFLGTDKDNAQDAIQKGRFVYCKHVIEPGEKALTVKLTWEKVRRIRQLHSEGNSQISIARMFDTDPSNISYIVNGKTWKEESYGL